MRIEVVTDKYNFFGIGEVLVHKLADFLCPVRLAATFAYGYPTPPFEWRGEHKSATSSVAYIFMVDFFCMVVVGKTDGLAGILTEFYGLFIHADHGPFVIPRPGIDFKHIFHEGDKGRVLLGRDAPHFFQVRLVPVFFRI